MLREVQPAFVIQCRSTGRFLTERLDYAVSFGDAGRLHDLEEAVDTAVDNLDDDYEIHRVWELVR